MGRTIVMAVDVPDEMTGELEVTGVLLTTRMPSGLVSTERRLLSRGVTPLDVCALFDQLCKTGMIEVPVPSPKPDEPVKWAKLGPINKRVLLPEPKDVVARPRLILPS